MESWCLWVQGCDMSSFCTAKLQPYIWNLKGKEWLDHLLIILMILLLKKASTGVLAMVQWVKNPVLPSCGVGHNFQLRFHPWLGNFHKPWVWPKKGGKKKKNASTESILFCSKHWGRADRRKMYKKHIFQLLGFWPLRNSGYLVDLVILVPEMNEDYQWW